MIFASLPALQAQCVLCTPFVLVPRLCGEITKRKVRDPGGRIGTLQRERKVGVNCNDHTDTGIAGKTRIIIKNPSPLPSKRKRKSRNVSYGKKRRKKEHEQDNVSHHIAWRFFPSFPPSRRLFLASLPVLPFVQYYYTIFYSSAIISLFAVFIIHKNL